MQNFRLSITVRACVFCSTKVNRSKLALAVAGSVLVESSSGGARSPSRVNILLYSIRHGDIGGSKIGLLKIVAESLCGLDFSGTFF